MDHFRVDNKVALITGAGSGLGRQFARTLAEAGASVVLAARRSDKLEETAAMIRADGGTATCLEMDVTDSASVRACFGEMLAAAGAPDIVVNNAGIGRQSPLADLSEEDWDAVIDTNLKGVFLVAQAAAKAMIGAPKNGSIINIASILGFRVARTLGAYVAAKSAVVNLTKTMALEWVRNGIRVNAIAPGYFLTEMNQQQFDQGAGAELIKRIPMQRIGETEELAGPLLLLASDAGSFMTGSTLTVDGGQLCSSL